MRLTRWVCFALCLGLAGCGTGRTPVRVDPALALLVPNDTSVLAGIRMDVLRATPWYQKSANTPLPVLDELAKQTGLDVRRDLWEALLVSDGVHTAALARGRFSEQGLEPNIDRPGLTRAPYKGYTVIGNEQGAFAFVNPTSVVAGRPDSVKFILDQRPESKGPPIALWEMAGSIPADNQIWLAATGALPNSIPNAAKISSLVESVKAGADLRSGLKAFVLGTARTSEDARTLADAVRGFLSLARLSTRGGQPELLKLYDGVQVEQQDRTVRLHVALSQEAFDQVLGTFR